MEGGRRTAPANDAASSGDATGGNGGDHGESACVNPIDRPLWVSGVREETSMLESEEKAAEEAEHPKTELPQGFYVIEAIRGKRVRKGQKQYLIKWYNYPEKDNTWEPLENLQEVSDIIDDFEESQSAKHHKRKRKHVTHSTQPKKRLQRSTTPYSPTCFMANGTDDHQRSPFVNVGNAELVALPQDMLFASEGENNISAGSHGRDEQPTENGSTSAPRQIADRWEQNDYGSKIGEVKASSRIATNMIDGDRLVINVKGANALTDNVQLDGPSNLDGREPVQNERCRGAKRRKSGPVKRFIRDPHVSESVDTEMEVNISGSAIEQAPTVVAGTEGNNVDDNQVAEAEDNHAVVKIVKTTDCYPPQSSKTQEAFVTFTALKSDGTEAVVSNKTLKTSNPLLLVNFYEQHLQYYPA